MEKPEVVTMMGVDTGNAAARMACAFVPSMIGRLPTKNREVFLTIDDGPTARSERLVEILLASNVTATWFVLGRSVNVYKSAMRRLASEGHQFGNHSFEHLDPWKERWSKVENDLNDGLDAIEQATGSKCLYTRPPFGRVRPGTLEWCRRHNQTVILWDVIAHDYGSSPNPDEIATSVRSSVRPGSILVMHDRDSEVHLKTIDHTTTGLLADGWSFGNLAIKR
jgi:peptidoglycan/xylan/chitin deacetylase (PgdA/CDA1 family)